MPNWLQTSSSNVKQGNRRHQTLPPLLPSGESLWVYTLLASRLLGWSYTTSSTQPEVHNVLDSFHRRTESQTQLTRTQNFVSLDEICEQTDIQAYKHAHRNTSHPYRGGGKGGEGSRDGEVTIRGAVKKFWAWLLSGLLFSGKMLLPLAMASC